MYVFKFLVISCESYIFLPVLATNMFPLDFNREKKLKSRLKRMPRDSGRTENCRRNRKRRRGN